MLHLVIGHRGTGKTVFLQRVQAAYQRLARPVVLLDLDAEIARRQGSSVADLFAQQGEAAFRVHERTTLRALLSELPNPADSGDVYVSLGAGYDEDPHLAVPAHWLPFARVLWLRRLTDAYGRVFVDPARPRLEPQRSPLAEYQARFAVRQARYQAWHDNVWMQPEGGEADPNPAEAQFIATALAGGPPVVPVQLPFVLTILPHQLARPQVFADWVARRLSWPGLRFELRDDLLSPAQLDTVQSLVPFDRRIWSLRATLPSLDRLRHLCQQNIHVDIPLELLSPPDLAEWARTASDRSAGAAFGSFIVSLHQREPGESIADAAGRLLSVGVQLGASLYKLAVEVADFSDLDAGRRWAQGDPEHRAFLPRTPSTVLQHGPERWRWFRALQTLRQQSPLSFVREGDGSSPDQPTLCEHWQLSLLSRPTQPPQFAAVLGDPVQHSRSPSEHRAFFAARGLPVFAVPCREADLAGDALATLMSLGLRCAAVTAPLKQRAGLLTGVPGCNTLWWDAAAEHWQGDNTDPLGLRALLALLPPTENVAVWGGGGVLPSVRAVLPTARQFALRDGAERLTTTTDATAPPLCAAENFRPDVVLWAAGSRGRDAACQPPATWQPRVVCDLDYREDSAGRDYALRVGAQYLSGLTMFSAQAAAQRAIWQHLFPTL